MMPAKVREALDLFSELVFIATALTIVVFASPVIRDLWDFDQRSQAAEFPAGLFRRPWFRSGSRIMALLVSCGSSPAATARRPTAPGH